MTPTEESGGIDVTQPRSSRRKLTALSVAAAVVIIVIIGALALLSDREGGLNPNGAGDSASSPSATPSQSTSSSRAPSATDSAAPSASPTVDPKYGAPVAETVPTDGEGDLDGAVTVRLGAITSITAAGMQIGEISGPAAQVDVELTNGGGVGISLDSVTVNAYYGEEFFPAPPIAAATGDDSFSGTLKPGEKATSRFVFTVSKEQQKTLTVTVSREAGSAIVVFSNAN